MSQDLALLLSVYEGHGLTPENGWDVFVVAKLEEKVLATSSVPLTSEPKFEVEMAWEITLDTLRMLRKSGVVVRVECLAEQQQGGQQRSLGYILLPLPSLDPDIKMKAQWHSLANGPHTRSRTFASLLISLNLKHAAGDEVVDDFLRQRANQKHAMEIDPDVASSPKESKLQFMKAANAAQEFDMSSKHRRRAGDKSGNVASHKRLSLSSKESDDIQVVEKSNRERNYAPFSRKEKNEMDIMQKSNYEKHNTVIIEDDQENNEWRFSRHKTQIECAQPTAKSFDSTHGLQELTNSLHGNSLSGSNLMKGTRPIQSRKSQQQSASMSSSSIKENGHRTDPQPSTRKINDIVALPSTSGAAAAAPDKLRAIPLLNAQGSYFQIGQAGEPGEQMFEYSVTIVFAKFLDQLVPPDMEIGEANNTMFCYSLLSHFVYGEPIKDLAHPDFQAENAMGRICSTVNNLSEYFMQHPDLPINLTVGGVCIATGTVRLAPFASSILTGGLPVQVEGSYPLVPNLFSPLGWKPLGEPVVGIIVTLSALEEQERSVLPFSAGVRDVMSSDRGFHPVMDYSSGSSTRTLSDSQGSVIDLDEQNDSLSQPRNHGTVARLGYKRKSKHKTRLQKEKQLQMAALEVEKWKESEQESYWKQWSVREAELQQHLAQEWESHMSSMENQLQQRLEHCHTLHKRLTDGLHALESRERTVNLKEEHIKTKKDELKLRKAELKRLLKEVGQISKKEGKQVEVTGIVNLQQQLLHEKRQRRQLQRQVRELEAAKQASESTVDALRLGNQVKDEDINLLKRDKERLQEELSACSQRKANYKMQWIKAVGQVHQARAEMNNYRVGIEKPTPQLHQPKMSIQYKEMQTDRRHLRGLPQPKVPEDEGRNDRVAEKFTDPKKFVKDLLNERKGLRDMVAKRKRMEEENESAQDDVIRVPPPSVVMNNIIHSLVDR